MDLVANTYYYEVHVAVPEWKTYKFQFPYSKCLNDREKIIEVVVDKGLLNRRAHLPFITVVKQISEKEFLPDDQLYFKTTMSSDEYQYSFMQKPDFGAKLVDKRNSYKKPKKIYAKKEVEIKNNTTPKN